MAFSIQKIVDTPDGVYQPIKMKLELSLATIFLLAFAGLAFFMKLKWPYLVLYTLVIPFQVISHLYQRKKFGPLGRPSVSVANDRLFIDLPGNSRGEMSLELAELKRLIVYGPRRRRKYRIVKSDGTWNEVTPIWRADLERHVIEFLQRTLPDRLTIEEPQTEFAFIRGDGPATPL